MPFLPPLHYVRKWSAPADDIKRSLLDDPAARAMPEEANREGSILYRHVVDEVLPRQEAAYGPSLAADIEQFRREMEGLTPGGSTAGPATPGTSPSGGSPTSHGGPGPGGRNRAGAGRPLRPVHP